jgi:hypothetical protein
MRGKGVLKHLKNINNYLRDEYFAQNKVAVFNINEPSQSASTPLYPYEDPVPRNARWKCNKNM